jgi:hypothetical protein
LTVNEPRNEAIPASVSTRAVGTKERAALGMTALSAVSGR